MSWLSRVFWLQLLCFVVVFVGMFFELLTGPYRFFSAVISFFVLGGLVLYFTRKSKVQRGRWLLYMTGGSSLCFLVGVVLHNLFYALSIAVHPWFIALDVLFFIVAVVLCPLAFLVGIIGVLWSLKQKRLKL